MAKIAYAAFDSVDETLEELIRRKIISVHETETQVIVGRYGTNKSALKKIAMKEVR